jgi:hypothetical protein
MPRMFVENEASDTQSDVASGQFVRRAAESMCKRAEEIGSLVAVE